MASSWVSGSWEPYKHINIHYPVKKIMLVEEPTVNNPNTEMPPGYSTVIDDGRWEPPTGGKNIVTIRHNKKSNANFADGHAQVIDYKFAADPLNNDPNQ